MLLFVFENNKVLSYPNIQLLSPLKPQVAFRKEHSYLGLLLLDYCYYILFTKLPWPGDSEGTFRSSSQAAPCPPVYTHGGGFTLSL